MSIVIAVALQKGGTGKTTVCRHLGHCLSTRGHKTLMIDLDPQHSLTNIIGATVAGTMAAVMGNAEPGTGKIAPIIVPVSAGLDLAPGGIGLALTESALILRRAREHILSRAIEQIAGNYDYILIDCPPALGLLLTNALLAARWVIVPTGLDSMSLDSIALFMGTMADLRADYPQAAELLGVVVNRANTYTVLGRDMLTAMRGRADLWLFDAIIPATVRLEEAALLKQPLHTYEPTNAAALAFNALTDEVINRGHA